MSEIVGWIVLIAPFAAPVVLALVRCINLLAATWFVWRVYKAAGFDVKSLTAASKAVGIILDRSRVAVALWSPRRR